MSLGKVEGPSPLIVHLSGSVGESGCLWASGWEALSNFESLLGLALRCTLISVGCSCEMRVEWMLAFEIPSKNPKNPCSSLTATALNQIWLIIQTLGKYSVDG